MTRTIRSIGAQPLRANVATNRHRRLTLLLTAAALLGAALPAAAETAGPTVTVYKRVTCDCCNKWVEHLKANGFRVRAVDVPDLEPYKQRYGVSQKLASCHTAVVEGYVIEGHVPADSIKRLLAQRPKVRGLSVPGMPIGSPGMEQNNIKDPYDVLAFDEKGGIRVFEQR